MADIRKRIGKKGVTYQVRYPDKHSKTGYSYETFTSMKQARHFSQNSSQWNYTNTQSIQTIEQATMFWLELCEKEGTDNQEPVTLNTLKTYRRRAEIMCEYPWEKPVQQLKTSDVVNFRSWLLKNHTVYIAHKTLSSFHTLMKELALRDIIDSNVASGVSIKRESRYDEEVLIPTIDEVKDLLSAADQLAQSKNKRIAKTWQRYRPILYLAADTGMRPQEYIVLGKSCVRDDQVKVERALEKGGHKLSVPKTKAGRRLIDISDKTNALLYVKKWPFGAIFARKLPHG